MFLKSNIDYLLEKHKTNPNELSEKHGIPQSTIFRIQNGLTENPRQSTLQAISKWSGVNVGDLLTKDLRSLNSSTQVETLESKKIESNVSKKAATLAPVLSWVQAGSFTNVQAIDMSQVEEWLPLPEECTNCFYLKVQGISNQPEFLEGDYILVDPDVYYSDMQSGDMIVVRKFEDATFKKLVIETDNSRYLQALNPDFKPNIIPLDEHCHFVGQVIDCMRYTYRAKRRSRPTQ
ncbi:S24 family peptidase [Acinetobacter higginsii]|uniref:S24 family peptidase n=1 Tax=Acinetobacter higginsii TaxID=70347 RepID=UPI002674A58D|nr:S24 family peptidase [Acinetobacter higginsii]MDO3663381.1 S24 family peptidase [Acinetobacter higginsii]